MLTTGAGNIHVLVVEDDPMVQRVLQLQLESRNYQVSTASDGAEGFAAAQADRPDVIILDLMMPKLSGFQVLKRIKTIEALAAIPVIILTASLDDLHRRKSLSHAADAYLTKPYAEAELHDCIESVVAAAAAESD